VVGADALGQTELVEQAGEHWLGLGHTGRREGLASEQEATVAIGDGQWIAVAAITSLEEAFVVGAPHLIGGIYVARGSARMSDDTALALLRDQAV
jgi:hypothetical protein